MTASIQFVGGAGTVTGSKFLLQLDGKRILVDCGLFQGVKDLRLQNWAPLPVDPKSIDAVIVTHAHLDHSGYVPLLVRNGFTGSVYCTFPTRDVARVILTDSAHIQEEDAEYANRMGYSKHAPALPLYSVADVQKAMPRFFPKSAGKWIDLDDETQFRFTPNGHIIGSACVELKHRGSRLVFSGDLGRQQSLMFRAPLPINHADHLVIESTYGDRAHSRESPQRRLGEIVNETAARDGHVLIPSFAVGRAQELLLLLSRLKAQHAIPDIPVFLDSPMGIDATEIFTEYPDWHKLDSDAVNAICSVATMVRSQKQSFEVLEKKKPTIVIAGSGMLGGGRVLHHLERRLPDERNTILLVGYQAAGTRGRLLRDGIAELKMHGQYVPVRARVEEISSLSAHADQGEILTWLKGFKAPPKMTFLVHGEPQAADALRLKIKDTLDWPCCVPHALETAELAG